MGVEIPICDYIFTQNSHIGGYGELVSSNLEMDFLMNLNDIADIMKYFFE